MTDHDGHTINLGPVTVGPLTDLSDLQQIVAAYPSDLNDALHGHHGPRAENDALREWVRRLLRDAGMLPAALDVIARSLDRWEWDPAEDCWWRDDGLEGDTEPEPNPDAVRAVLDLAKDRQP